MTELPRLGRDEYTQPKLYHIRIVGLGLAHICIGIVTIVVGVFDVASLSLLFNVFPTAKVATAIWVGFVIFLTGASGVVTSRSELRRRTANFIFLTLSTLSWALCIVMIGIAVFDIASSEFACISMQTRMHANSMQLTPGEECLNLTTVYLYVSNNTIRCISKSIFDQKLILSSLMVVLGYIESMVAFYSVIIAYDIYKKIKLSFLANQNVEMTHIPDIPLPGVTVNEYFEERMQREDGEQRENRREGEEQVNRNIPFRSANNHPPTLQTSASSGEFPDSDQFRSHLEGLP